MIVSALRHSANTIAISPTVARLIEQKVNLSSKRVNDDAVIGENIGQEKSLNDPRPPAAAQ